MTDATERARAVIAQADDANDYVLGALMADPSLLVDLALEAGGLELFADCGHCAGRQECKYELAMLNDAPECVPVYRRKEKT